MNKILLIILVFSFIFNIILFILCCKFYNYDKLYVKESINPKLGRGVFTSRYITKGEIIEQSPFITQDRDDFIGNITNYLFTYDDDLKLSAVGFGYSSLYNHDDDNNAYWQIDDNYIYIIALKDIPENNEIFISYGEPYWEARDMPKLNKIN
jgi:SET domain-containing protein